MLLIDKYAYTNRLRDYSPQVKILLACGSLVLLRSLDNNYLYILNIVFMLGLTLGVAKIPFKNYGRMLSIPIVFLLTSLIMIVLSINSGDYIYYISLRNIKIGVTEASLYKGLNLLISVISSLTSVYFLMLTTPIDDIIRILNKVGLPSLIIELMVLIYRSIFIFLDEANNIHLAQTMKFGYENKKNALKSISLLINNLFLRVLIKHREMNIALECKLYDGEFKLGD